MTCYVDFGIFSEWMVVILLMGAYLLCLPAKYNKNSLLQIFVKEFTNSHLLRWRFYLGSGSCSGRGLRSVVLTQCMVAPASQ